MASLAEDANRWRHEREELVQQLDMITRARDSFKQQYLELKEANKDLKAQFKDIESKVTHCISDAKLKELKENQRPL